MLVGNYGALRDDCGVDPRSASLLKFRCRQMNYVESSHVGGERKYLFAPHSVFTVKRAYCPVDPTEYDPIEIELEAATDNKLEPEEVHNAPWA